MGWDAIGAVIGTVVVAILGWIATRGDDRRKAADAARVPGLEAANRANEWKARDAARDDDGLGLRVEDGAPRIQAVDTKPDGRTALDDVLDRVRGD